MFLALEAGEVESSFFVFDRVRRDSLRGRAPSFDLKYALLCKKLKPPAFRRRFENQTGIILELRPQNFADKKSRECISTNWVVSHS